MASKKAHLLLFADDIVLLTGSHNGLQTSVDHWRNTAGLDPGQAVNMYIMNSMVHVIFFSYPTVTNMGALVEKAYEVICCTICHTVPAGNIV